MSSIAILSDIHGNIEALDAVLGDLKSHSYDITLCTGDLVGYGPRPNEVINRIREIKISTVMGNYDEAVGFTLPACGCHIDNPRQKELSRHSLKWSIEHTTPANREYLRSLPESISMATGGKTILLIHASDDSISEYIYQSDDERIRQILMQTNEHIYIYGHTHFPFIKRVGTKWIVNAGSVGRPKDGDNRACYVRMKIEDGKVHAEIRRISYDVEKVVQDVENSGLDPAFGEFLRNGGDRHMEMVSAASCPIRELS